MKLESKTESKKSILYAVYCAAIMAMNVLAAKQIDVLGFTVTCGIFTSGFVFIAQDLMTEWYGAKESRKMIYVCYASSLVMVLLYQIAIIVPKSLYWDMQHEFESVLKTTLRITIASVIAYLLGSVTNTSIMGKMKEKNPDSLFVRAVTSTLFGQLLDNGVFAVIAFAFVLPWNAIGSMTIGGTIIEVITEVVCYPILKYLASK